MILTINDNFNLQKIADSGQCFRVKELEDGAYQFISNEKILKVKKVGKNKYSGNWDPFWQDYFDLNTNYSNIHAPEGILEQASEFSAGIRILKQDPWEMLISFIISQRNSITSIKKSIEKMCSIYGDDLAEGIKAFPSAEALSKASNESLKNCSLGYRVSYVKESAITVSKNPRLIDQLSKLDTETLIKKLKEFKGVGDKVANCVALFGFHRLECAPVDTWINKFNNKYYNGKNVFESAGEYAGVLQQYAFYYMRYN